MEQLFNDAIDFFNTTKTDFYFYSGPITLEGADKFYKEILENKSKREKAALILTTFGGDPNAAYRIARILKREYEGFRLYVLGFCKSAGTLIAVGANEIIMSEYGELGPLDIQIPKIDELNHESGLVYSQALQAIKNHAFDYFEECWLTMKNKSGGTISTKTASSIASSLAIGLFSPLAEQIDPLKVGEANRALTLSLEYGQRLTNNTAALDKLISGYTDHGFVIDWEEAKDIFKNVRKLNKDEEKIFLPVHRLLREPQPQLAVAFVDNFINEISGADEKEDEDVNDGSEGPSPESDQSSVEEEHGSDPEESKQENHLSKNSGDSEAEQTSENNGSKESTEVKKTPSSTQKAGKA